MDGALDRKSAKIVEKRGNKPLTQVVVRLRPDPKQQTGLSPVAPSGFKRFERFCANVFLAHRPADSLSPTSNNHAESITFSVTVAVRPLAVDPRRPRLRAGWGEEYPCLDGVGIAIGEFAMPLTAKALSQTVAVRRRPVWRPAFRFAFCSLLLAVIAFTGAALTDASAKSPANPLRSLVRISAEVPADARTARSLGTERVGTGVMIGGDGLILTIGYLILEADEILVTDQSGETVPATFVAYDHESGFGLVRSLSTIDAVPVRLGDSTAVDEGDTVLVGAIGGPGDVRPTQVVSRRSFAGSWEYLLERAVFTSPPIRQFGGAGLFADDGRLVGIGSLIVSDAAGTGAGGHGNMFVPIGLLKPILADLLAFGASTSPANPWLGLYPQESGGVLVVGRVADGGPAEQAGLSRGDIILSVGPSPVREMSDFYRKVWALGDAGVAVPLKVLKGDTIRDVRIESMDRTTWLKLRRTY